MCKSASSGANSVNFPQNAGANPEPAHFRHFISSLNPDDPSVTWIQTLDFLSRVRLERDGRLFESRVFFLLKTESGYLRGAGVT